MVCHALEVTRQGPFKIRQLLLVNLLCCRIRRLKLLLVLVQYIYHVTGRVRNASLNFHILFLLFLCLIVPAKGKLRRRHAVDFRAAIYLYIKLLPLHQVSDDFRHQQLRSFCLKTSWL